MTAATIAPQYAAPRYAPEFAVKINGDSIPLALRRSITSVTYQDGHNAADRVELGIANVDLRWLQSHIRGLGFRAFPTGLQVGPSRVTAPDNLFDVDNKLELSLGYAGSSLEDVFKGEITGLEASFPTGGMPALTLVAHDYLHRLSQGTYARGFGVLPDVVIAAILSAENLLVPLIDPVILASSAVLAAVNGIFSLSGRKQKGQSDLCLLKEIAAQYDADFWVDGDLLFFSRFVKEYEPRLTLTWGKSLLEFAPKVSTVGRIAGAAAKFTLREIPLSFLVDVFWDFDREVLGIKVIPGEAAAYVKSITGPTYTIVDQPITSPADIATSALKIARELRKRLNRRLVGAGVAVGDPKIRAGAVIRLDGMGPDFSGNYRVKAATHVVDTHGYRTAFEVFKEIIP
jgi:phage protein D